MARSTQTSAIDPLITLARRVDRSSRSAARIMTVSHETRRAGRSGTESRVIRTGHAGILRRAARIALRTARIAAHRAEIRQRNRAAAVRFRQPRALRGGYSRSHSRARQARLVARPGRGMAAVLAYARSQVGKRYVRGAEGPFSFDCSGFTKRAYARAGLWLPHSSGAQAARARTVSRSRAQPGDLVVGAGHVGVYMGDGMMIDAGNSRVGVTYRPVYAGLHIERF